MDGEDGKRQFLDLGVYAALMRWQYNMFLFCFFPSKLTTNISRLSSHLREKSCSRFFPIWIKWLKRLTTALRKRKNTKWKMRKKEPVNESELNWIKSLLIPCISKLQFAHHHFLPLLKLLSYRFFFRVFSVCRRQYLQKMWQTEILLILFGIIVVHIMQKSQVRGFKYILKDYNSSYEQLLDKVNLTSLSSRCLQHICCIRTCL